MTPRDRAEIARTGGWIASVQHSDGAIPDTATGGLSPWNHVESAMALDVAGLAREAAAAYRWSAARQNPDGSLHAGYDSGGVSDAGRDTNFTAYLATGVHHHMESTQDTAFLAELWPSVRGAIDFVVGTQAPTGVIPWRAGESMALRTGCASIYGSLRSAERLAELVGEAHPQWTEARTRLGAAVLGAPEAFEPKPHAMDWYYPVLAGLLSPAAALGWLRARWDEFVVAGHGVRCVSGNPWVTGGETSELCIALAGLGHRNQAARLLATTRRLRTAEGAYWTGYHYPHETFWPREQTTWTAAAVLLATAALNAEPATLRVFAQSR